MAAASTDYFTEVGSPGTATTLAAPGHSIGGSSFTVVSTSNWPTNTGVVFAVDNYTLQTVNGVPNTAVRTAGTYTEWEGVVSSSTSITGAVLRYGTDQNYSAGSLTRVYIPVASSRENRLAQGIQVQHNQDGTHGAVTATSLSAPTVTATTSVTENGSTLAAIRAEQGFDYVASGLVWSGDSYASTRNASMTAGVVYINGQRGSISAVTARSFTASKDTYVDILNTAGVFTVVYTEVTNNVASPALAANSLRIGIIVTGATNIAAATSVNQGQETMLLPIASGVPYSVTDSLGNLICPRDPNRQTLGYRQSSTAQTGISASAVLVTGLTEAVIVPTGRKVRIEAQCPYFFSTTAATWSLYIYNSATVTGSPIQTTSILQAISSAILGGSIWFEHTPAAGSQSYCIAISCDNGTGNTSGLTTTKLTTMRVGLA